MVVLRHWIDRFIVLEKIVVGIDLICTVGLRRKSNYELRIMNFELKEFIIQHSQFKIPSGIDLICTVGLRLTGISTGKFHIPGK